MQLAITDTVQVSGSSVSSFVVRFYLSPDQAITSSDTLVGSRTVSSPVVGAPSTATTTVTLSTGLGGDLHLGAIVDAPSQIPESDEGNNASAGPVVAIGRTDLALTALASTPATLRAGGTLSITDTVRATGGAAAASVLKFYLSPDSTITAADTLIGQRTVSALAAEGRGRMPRLRKGSEWHHPPSSSEEGRPRAS